MECGDEGIQVILYADDLVLLARDPDLLQKYLRVLEDFCDATCMTVNVSKSEVLVFFKKNLQKKFKWKFGGKFLKEVQEFVYLGTVLDSNGFKTGVRKSIKRRLSKAKNALFGMIGTCHGFNIYDLKVLNTLFDGIVAPSALYGSEIWGPDMFELRKGSTSFSFEPIEDLQNLFLRMALWMGKATPHFCLRKEAGRIPLSLKVYSSSIRFWNKICARPSGCILRSILSQDIKYVPHGWTWSLHNMVQHMTGRVVITGCEDDWLTRIPIKDVMDAICARWEAYEATRTEDTMRQAGDGNCLVRQIPDRARDGFKTFKYKLWFLSNWDTHDLPMYHVQDVYDIRTLARFRCGMHWLKTEKNRDLPRSERLCDCCRLQDREDELHVFMCEAYSELRTEFPDVFESVEYLSLVNAVNTKCDSVDNLMNKLMNKGDYIASLVGYLRRSIKIRDTITGGRTNRCLVARSHG